MPDSQSAPQLMLPTVTVCPVLSCTTHCKVALKEPYEYLLKFFDTEHWEKLALASAAPCGLLVKLHVYE
ncbi:hypothetical protein ASD07_10765 [Duganella sp. Root336D2]|nr:hypothetical protein ASD07_10765 [Duganella sp. Root336D2]